MSTNDYLDFATSSNNNNNNQSTTDTTDNSLLPPILIFGDVDMKGYVPPWMSTLYIVSNICTFVFGALGNFFIILVYQRTKCKTPCDWFILFIAYMDLIVCVSHPWLNLRQEFDWHILAALDFNVFFCALHNLLNFSAMLSSSFILTLMALERYVKVCRPSIASLTGDTAKLLSYVAMAVSIVMCFYPSYVIFTENGCEILWGMIASAYMLFVFCVFSVCFLVVSMSYASVIRRIELKIKVKRRLLSNNGLHDDDKLHKTRSKKDVVDDNDNNSSVYTGTKNVAVKKKKDLNFNCFHCCNKICISKNEYREKRKQNITTRIVIDDVESNENHFINDIGQTTSLNDESNVHDDKNTQSRNTAKEKTENKRESQQQTGYNSFRHEIPMAPSSKDIRSPISDLSSVSPEGTQILPGTDSCMSSSLAADDCSQLECSFNCDSKCPQDPSLTDHPEYQVMTRVNDEMLPNSSCSGSQQGEDGISYDARRDPCSHSHIMTANENQNDEEDDDDDDNKNNTLSKPACVHGNDFQDYEVHTTSTTTTTAADENGILVSTTTHESVDNITNLDNTHNSKIKIEDAATKQQSTALIKTNSSSSHDDNKPAAIGGGKKDHLKLKAVRLDYSLSVEDDLYSDIQPVSFFLRRAKEKVCNFQDKLVKRKSNNSSTTCHRHKKWMKERRMTLMLFSITFMFLLSWIPPWSLCLCMIWEHRPFESATTVRVAYRYWEKMSLLQYCTNFFIYYAFNPGFRKKVHSLFTCSGEAALNGRKVLCCCYVCCKKSESVSFEHAQDV